jgi:hypothetical protein
MIKNIKNSFNHEEIFSDNFLRKLNTLNNDQIIDLYLDEKGDYYPVSSEEFGKKFGLEVSGGASNPEHSKKVALLDFISKYNDLIMSGKYVSTSLGFSDDDPKNIKAMVNYVENELANMYPEVKFLIYDTSEGGYKKIHIEANKEEIDNHILYQSNLENRFLHIRDRYPNFNRDIYRKNYPYLNHLNDLTLELHYIYHGNKNNDVCDRLI